MLGIRKSNDRGHAQHGWLESYHTFSFAGYHDPEFMGFRALRVINEDRVQPAAGFGTHSHRDMEIISYVIEGALEHNDSMGNGSTIRPGEVQLMRAGTGVTHSEYNHSKTDLVHFLQIWVIPDEEGLEPAYDQREFPAEERRGRFRLVASPDGADGSIRVQQDLSLFATLLGVGQSLQHVLPPARHAWVQVVKGDLSVNGVQLSAGDGLGITEEPSLELVASSGSEALLFDLG
jgi:redox-sensitive bicupin YhaK (pirin superfamily)